MLPPVRGDFDVAAVAEALLEREAPGEGWPYQRVLDRLLQQHAERIPPWDATLLRARAALFDPRQEASAHAALRALAQQAPGRPEPYRAIGHHLATRRGEWRAAANAFA